FKVVLGFAPHANEWFSEAPELLGEGRDGKFAFRLQAGNFPGHRNPLSTEPKLWLEAEGYATRVVPLPKQTNDIELTIEMERGGEIEGVVLLPSGQPAVGAEVTFSGHGMGGPMMKPGE